MDTQAKIIRNSLEAENWLITNIENPESRSYWWLWESWIIHQGKCKLFLSYLVDPQSSKSKSSVWAVTAIKREPHERLEAEQGIFLSLGKGWEDKLPEFIDKLNAEC